MGIVFLYMWDWRSAMSNKSKGLSMQGEISKLNFHF